MMREVFGAVITPLLEGEEGRLVQFRRGVRLPGSHVQGDMACTLDYPGDMRVTGNGFVFYMTDVTAMFIRGTCGTYASAGCRCPRTLDELWMGWHKRSFAAITVSRVAKPWTACI